MWSNFWVKRKSWLICFFLKLIRQAERLSSISRRNCWKKRKWECLPIGRQTNGENMLFGIFCSLNSLNCQFQCIIYKSWDQYNLSLRQIWTKFEKSRRSGSKAWLKVKWVCVSIWESTIFFQVSPKAQLNCICLSITKTYHSNGDKSSHWLGLIKLLGSIIFRAQASFSWKN